MRAFVLTYAFLLCLKVSIAHGKKIEYVDVLFLQRLTDARVPEEQCNNANFPYVKEKDSLLNVGTCPLDSSWQSVAVLGLLGVKHFNERNPRYIKELASDSEIMQGCNKQIRVTMKDSGSTGVTSVKQLLEVIEKQTPDIIVGPSRSAVSTVTNSISSVFNIPQLSYWATSTKLSDKSEYKSFFRLIPDTTASAYALCKFLENIGYKFSNIFYMTDPYGESYKDSLFQECTTVKLESFGYNDNDIDDVKLKLGRLKETKVNSWIFISVSSESFNHEILEYANDIGLLGKGMLMISTDGILFDTYATIKSAEVKKAVNGSVHIVATGASSFDPLFQNFSKDWESGVFSVDEVNEHMPPYYKLKESFFQNPDAATLYNDNVYVPGVFNYDSAVAAGLYACLYSKTKPIPKDWDIWFQSKTSSGITNRQSLNFNGFSGNIVIDSNGNRDASTGKYELYNIQLEDKGENSKLVLKQQFDNEKQNWVQIQNRVTLFTGGTSTPPEQVILPEINHISLKPYDTFGYVMFALIFTFGLFCIAWTMKYINHQVVKASQRSFLLLIVLGVFITITCFITMAVQDEGDAVNDYKHSLNGNFAPANNACMATIWLYNIGFCVTFAPLFAKMWRVNRLFNNKKMRRLSIKDLVLYKIIGATLLLDICILIPFQVLYPVKFRRFILSTDEFGNAIETTGYCEYGQKEPLTFWIVLQSLHILYLIFGCYLCYQGRNVDTAFQEAKYVTIAIVANLQVLCLAIPVMFLTYTNAVVFYIVISGVVFLNSITVLVSMFVPKIILVYLKPELEAPKPRKSDMGSNSNGSYPGSTELKSSGTKAKTKGTRRYNSENWSLSHLRSKKSSEDQKESVSRTDEMGSTGIQVDNSYESSFLSTHLESTDLTDSNKNLSSVGSFQTNPFLYEEDESRSEDLIRMESIRAAEASGEHDEMFRLSFEGIVDSKRKKENSDGANSSITPV